MVIKQHRSACCSAMVESFKVLMLKPGYFSGSIKSQFPANKSPGDE